MGSIPTGTSVFVWNDVYFHELVCLFLFDGTQVLLGTMQIVFNCISGDLLPRPGVRHLTAWDRLAHHRTRNDGKAAA